MASNINADNGVVSGVAGLKTSADNSGVLALQTNGTTAVTVNASQNVGIGTTTPAFDTGSGLRIDRVNAPATIRLAQTGTGASGFEISAANGNAQFDYRTGDLLFLKVGSEKARMVTDGLQMVKSIGLGGTAPNSSGVGITFPATQSASSDANTLDDYEEGTWTPASGGGTATTAYYTKIGRMVYVYGDVTFTGVSSPTQSITGLPFAPSGTQTAMSISYQNLSTSGISAIIVTSLNRIDVYNLVEAAINVANNKRMIFSCMYQST